MPCRTVNPILNGVANLGQQRSLSAYIAPMIIGFMTLSVPFLLDTRSLMSKTISTKVFNPKKIYLDGYASISSLKVKKI